MQSLRRQDRQRRGRSPAPAELMSCPCTPTEALTGSTTPLVSVLGSSAWNPNTSLCNVSMPPSSPFTLFGVGADDGVGVAAGVAAGVGAGVGFPAFT